MIPVPFNSNNEATKESMNVVRYVTATRYGALRGLQDHLTYPVVTAFWRGTFDVKVITLWPTEELRRTLWEEILATPAVMTCHIMGNLLSRAEQGCEEWKEARERFAFWVHSRICEKRLLVSSCISGRLYVRPPSARNNSVPNGRNFMKLCVWAFFENLSRKFKFCDLPRVTGNFHEDQNTILIISRSILLRTKNISEKDSVISPNIQFIFNYVSPKWRSLWDVLCENMTKSDMSQKPV